MAWLGIVPFRMSGIRPRLVPPIPGLSAFPELNVRTYVRPVAATVKAQGAAGDDAASSARPGVWFFSLDATNPLAVRVARWAFSLPYFDANIACAVNGGTNTPTVHYSSRRTHAGAPPAELDMDYRPAGPVFNARPGTLEYFLVERYCLYAATAGGRTSRCEVAHAPWSLQPATATIRRNTMTRQLGFDAPGGEPVLHYADFLEVVAWMPQMI